VLSIESDLVEDTVRHDHEDDEPIRSCGIVADLALDWLRFNHWVIQLVQRQSTWLIHGAAKRYRDNPLQAACHLMVAL